MSHTIYRNVVHLPNGQYIYFDPERVDNDMLTDIVKENENKDTMLTAWFNLNETDENAREYLYAEIAEHYVFNKKDRVWTKREKGGDKILSRMYQVSPKEEELFYLRVLLLHVRGARSFENIRTAPDRNGVPVLYETFKEAARARGLTRDDAEFDECMREATTYRMPRQMRQLFVNLCEAGMVDDYLQLYQAHKKAMYEDFQRAHPGAGDNIWENYLLDDLNEKFQMQHKTNEEFGLPMPNEELKRGTNAYKTIARYNFSRMTVEQHKEIAERMRESFNDEQNVIHDLIMESVDKKSKDTLFFIEASGGCGKSYLLNVS